MLHVHGKVLRWSMSLKWRALLHLTLIQIFPGSSTHSLRYFRRRVKVTHSTADYPLRPGRGWGIFFSHNAALIDGLRFMSRSSDMITHAAWPSIHISLFASQFIPLPSFGLLPHFHSIIPLLFPAPHVISLLHPIHPPTPALPSTSTAIISHSFSSLSTASSPLHPEPVINCWDRQLQNSDQPLCGLRRLAKLPLRLINSSTGCG